MNASNFPQPSLNQLVRFRDGDPLAINEVVELVLPALQRWAWARYTGLPREDVRDMVNQVVAETCYHHSRYDPTQTSFTTYVIGLLRRRLVDLYQQQREREEHEEIGPDVYEKLLAVPYNDIDTLDEDTRIVREAFFQQVEEHLEAMEREIFQLMREGQKSRKAFASVLARYRVIQDEAHEVKNEKARILRKVAFLGKTLGYIPEDLQ